MSANFLIKHPEKQFETVTQTPAHDKFFVERARTRHLHHVNPNYS